MGIQEFIHWIPSPQGAENDKQHRDDKLLLSQQI